MHELSGLTSRHSLITLCSSQDSSSTIDFCRLKRAREPVSRSKAGVQGKVADVFGRRSRHAESQNELRGFQVLLATGRTSAWQEQPFHLDYPHEGAVHRYTPDILVAWNSYREVVEIKDDAYANEPANQERLTLLSELLAEHGYRFRVWRRSEIDAEPRLTNVGLALRYRCVQITPLEHEGVRRVFASVSSLPLRVLQDFHGISIQSAMRLVLGGTLHVNWWKRITLHSEISHSPIGPQVWPCPPHGTLPLDCGGSIDGEIRI